MLRFWLALLLTLVLQPVPAAASAGAPRPAPEQSVAQDADAADQLARLAGGLERVAGRDRLERRLSDGPTRSRDAGTPAAAPLVAPHARVVALRRAAAALRLPAHRNTHPPYYATAPPASR